MVSVTGSGGANQIEDLDILMDEFQVIVDEGKAETLRDEQREERWRVES